MATLAARSTTPNCASLERLLPALGCEASDLHDPASVATLLRAARRHGVQPLLHRALLDGNTSLPAAQWSELQQDIRRNAIRNLQLSGESLRLLRLLEKNGITALPYKGPAMASALWGSPDLRECADLDLLVLPQDAPRAAEVIARAGYTQLIRMSRHELQRHVRVAAELQFADAAGSLLELQWRIVPRCFAVELELAPMWPRLETQTFCGTDVAALAPADLLLVLSVHGWKHAWERLIWVADIAQLLATRAIDLEAVLRRATELRLRRILLLGLALAQREFGAELTKEIASAISRDPRVGELANETVTRHRDAGETSYRQWQRYMLRARDGFADRVRHTAGFVFTPGLGEQRMARGVTALYLPARAARLSARAARALWKGTRKPQ